MRANETSSKFFHNQKGASLIELVIVISLIVILSSAYILIINPMATEKRSRDTKRLSDLAHLSRAIEEYISDNGTPPDFDLTQRSSNTVASGAGGDIYFANGGWILADMADYITSFPTDPLNTNSHVYKYMRSDKQYELNAVLESDSSSMQGDGGNNPNVYEVGTSLSIIN